jgi:hypothetical protein
MTETSHLLPQFLLDQETGGKCSENKEGGDLCQHFYTTTWYLSELIKSSDSILAPLPPPSSLAHGQILYELPIRYPVKKTSTPPTIT